MPTRKKGTKPVRDVAKRTNRGCKAYIVPTDRNENGFVAGQSFTERNHLLMNSLRLGLKHLSDQPVCIDLENETLVASRDDLPKKSGKKVKSYTPDAEYELEDGQVVVCESKPSAFLEKNEEKHALAEKILGKYGKSFITMTEVGFTPVFISNLENLKKALSSAQLRIPRHSDTQPTLIRTPVPRSFGQAVGAQRRRGCIVSLRRPAPSISSPAFSSTRP
ncbi:hypothetical protein N1078_12520, partial [Pseudomonas sp. MIL19]|nr:hypothetical protein [Pseudomonas sp. MIL19]